eukprot:COSAG04_NODE_838_length_9963_cov_6.375912_6_plen_101_part_00
MWGEKFWPAAWQSRWCQLRKQQRRHRQLFEQDQVAGQKKQGREWQVGRFGLHRSRQRSQKLVQAGRVCTRAADSGEPGVSKAVRMGRRGLRTRGRRRPPP